MNNNHFIRIVDRLGYRPVLFINQHERNASIIGACLTIAVACLSFAIFLFYCIEFILGSGMNVVSFKKSLDESISFNLSNKLFMFRFMDRSGNKVDPRVAEIYASHWTYEKAKLEHTFFELEECQYERHFPQEGYNINFKNIDISDYLCLHPDSNMTLSYDGDSIKGSHILITVAKCTNTTKTGEKCFSLSDIQTILDGESYYFSYSIANTHIDHYNFKSPLQYSQFNNNVIITTTVSYDYTMYYKFINYNSDKGWLLNDWITTKGFQFDESLTEKIIHTDDPAYLYENAFGSYKFKLGSSFMNNYERTFPKFPTIIGNISSLSKVAFLIGELIIKFCSTGYYYFDLITLLQSRSLNKKQSIKDVNKLQRANILTQAKINSKKEINSNEKFKLDPFASCMWMIFPKASRNTRQVELFKQKVAELLSVENLILNMFTTEAITSNVFEKRNEPTNTSSSAMNIKSPINILVMTENKKCLFGPIVT